MTVRAAASFIDVSVQNAPTGVPSFYGTSYDLSVVDDAIGDNVTFGRVNIQIPLSFKSQKKIDDFIRQALADAVLARTPSLVIDPDDIYIPFSAR